MTGAESEPGATARTPHQDRVALVTGAARGIGAATVHRLLAQGYRVTAVDAPGDGADLPMPGVRYKMSTRDELHRLGEGRDDVLHVVADVRERAALARAVDQTLERFGRLDVAVAAAAVIVGGQPLWETPEDHVATVWDVDILGVWNTAAVTVPAMLAGPEPSGCRFVAIASAAGHRGLFHLSAYSVAKHAVVGLVRSLAADLRNTGVTAVAVSPGSTRTDKLDATAAIYGLPDAEALSGSMLLGRLLTSDEVASVVTACCSLEGAILNGSVVHADGGFLS